MEIRFTSGYCSVRFDTEPTPEDFEEAKKLFPPGEYHWHDPIDRLAGFKANDRGWWPLGYSLDVAHQFKPVVKSVGKDEDWRGVREHTIQLIRDGATLDQVIQYLKTGSPE